PSRQAGRAWAGCACPSGDGSRGASSSRTSLSFRGCYSGSTGLQFENSVWPIARGMNGLDSMDLFDFGILLQALANNMKVGMLAVRAESRVKFLQLEKTRIVAIYTAKPKVSLG